VKFLTRPEEPLATRVLFRQSPSSFSKRRRDTGLSKAAAFGFQSKAAFSSDTNRFQSRFGQVSVSSLLRVLIGAEQTTRSTRRRVCPGALCSRTPHERNGFSPLGEGKRGRERERERDLFHEHASSGIDDRLHLRRVNATLCLPERRELRLPSVNMSARIFHSRRSGGTPLSRQSGALHRASILLYRSPRINSVCRSLLASELFGSRSPPALSASRELCRISKVPFSASYASFRLYETSSPPLAPLRGEAFGEEADRPISGALCEIISACVVRPSV